MQVLNFREDGVELPTQLGEGLVRPAGDLTALWWVDIKGSKIFRLKLSDGLQTSIQRWDCTVFLTAIVDVQLCPEGFDILAVGGGGGNAGLFASQLKLDASHATNTKLLSAPQEFGPNERFNDGNWGPDGRFYCGTMDADERQRIGRLFAISFDNEGVQQWSQIDPSPTTDRFYGVTNGPVFFGGTMYHNDSQAQQIYQFSFDEDNGRWVDKRVFFQFGPGEGFPDGMCVSEEGILYVAMWGGACIERFDLNSLSISKRLSAIKVPAQNPTRPCLSECGSAIFTTSAEAAGSSTAKRHKSNVSTADGGLLRIELED